MNSISLKEAAARWGVSERRISQLANEPGSGVWRVERGRYSFDPPQNGNHFSSENEMLYKVKWLAEKGEFKEAEKITEKIFQSEIDNPKKPAGERAVALLNLIWFEDTQLRELSGSAPPPQSFSEVFNNSKNIGKFSQEQIDYSVNHTHQDIGMFTPDDRTELINILKNKFNKLLELNDNKKKLPKLSNEAWHLLLIDIFGEFKKARVEREGKPRLDYIEQAVEIVDDCF